MMLLQLSILTWLLYESHAYDDSSYELLYNSNLEEQEDLPIHFSPPQPSWLQGSLIRNVAARFELGNRNFTHPFDAFAKPCSWVFHNNQTTFSTKFIRSLSYNASLKQRTIAPYLLSGEVVPGFNELQRIEQIFHGVDNMNVIVNQINRGSASNAFVALSDVWPMYQFDPKSLATVRRIVPQLEGRNISSNEMSSAHMTPEKGTTNFFALMANGTPLPSNNRTLSVVRVKAADERELLVSLHVERTPYIHSFSVTENYVIVFAPPYYVNVLKLLATAAIFKALEYHPDKDTSIYVINIKTKEVTELSTPNVFIMHHVNAFEITKQKVVVDICTYKTPDVIGNYSLDILRNATKRNKVDATPQLKRYVINLSAKKVTPSVFPSTKGAEFANLFDMPAINENYRFGNYCFVYGVALKIDKTHYSNCAIIKKNLCKGGEDIFWNQEFHYPMEPKFVGRPNATEEDDGVLLVQVLDGPRKQTYLAILDSKTMKMISKAYLPTIVPISFHGNYFL